MRSRAGRPDLLGIVSFGSAASKSAGGTESHPPPSFERPNQRAEVPGESPHIKEPILPDSSIDLMSVLCPPQRTQGEPVEHRAQLAVS